MPNTSSFRRPASVSQSLVQGGDRTSSMTAPSNPLHSSAAAIIPRITSVAGHPEYVGVIPTCNCACPSVPTSHRTCRTIPRSTTVNTGISGSGTAPSTSQTRCSRSPGSPTPVELCRARSPTTATASLGNVPGGAAPVFEIGAFEIGWELSVTTTEPPGRSAADAAFRSACGRGARCELLACRAIDTQPRVAA